MSRVINPASALGEAVGNLIEEKILETVKPIAKKYNYVASPSTLKNGLNNKHRIDIVVCDLKKKPVILIEPKYLRYTKHNWDKGSRLCIAHYSLRKTFSSIRKSIAVLAGNWTSTSKAFIESFGVEIFEIQFSKIVDVFDQYGIKFDWDEKDNETPRISWNSFGKMSNNEKEKLAYGLTEGMKDKIAKSVETTLILDPSAPKKIESLEILLRTIDGESYVNDFKSVNEAIKHLLSLQTDVRDLKNILK